MGHYGLREDLYRAEIDNLALHLVGESNGVFEDLIVSTERAST